MEWSYLLCLWLYLPRAQPLLPSVHPWRFSDTSADTRADTTTNDNDDHDNSIDDNADNHFNERVQAFLRAELRQLVVQMLMGLLHRMFSMRDSPSNDYYNLECNHGDDNHNHTSLQALVCNKHRSLDNKVQKEKVFWLC